MIETHRIIMSPDAAADLKALHGHISLDSPNNAAKMVERILASIESLKLFPHRSVVRHASHALNGRFDQWPSAPTSSTSG